MLRKPPWIYRARPLYVGHCKGVNVGIIWASPGAPLAAMVMEHLIACGAKYIIGIGLIAAIQPDIDIGTLVIPIKVIRGEGMPYYYLPENVEAVADRDILQALRRACKELGVGYIEGEIYTTDTIHRETKKLIEALRKRNVIGIDMETSAIYSVGIYHKVKVSCVLIVSTNPRTKSIGFYSNSLNESISKAIKVLKNAIKLFASNEEVFRD